jgi:biopolymer transport protein ExbD
MNAVRRYVIGLVLLCAVAAPAYSAATLPKVVVTEGDYIGYATVADALATFKSEGFLELPGLNGEVSFAEPDNKTTWTFTGKEERAYPAVARYVYTRSPGVERMEFTVLCEASTSACDKFRADIRNNVTQMAKMMIAGDSSVACRVTDHGEKCGTTPVRKQSDQQIYVEITADTTCTVDGVATDCPDVGRTIRAVHQSDNPRTLVCASPTIKYDVIGKVLGALTREDLPARFGCPPR